MAVCLLKVRSNSLHFVVLIFDATSEAVTVWKSSAEDTQVPDLEITSALTLHFRVYCLAYSNTEFCYHMTYSNPEFSYLLAYNNPEYCYNLAYSNPEFCYHLTYKSQNTVIIWPTVIRNSVIT
ncbi:hypothetical protein DdX_15703 [Ditylenchus destructor]|uniref:Uncharacterized protein n=1 Tax=Ditylenchus destructor TaxID=166010 RepID=A0AAD4R0M5_9BILA|nr:hypothetical protein DdX_15703 [Ditylenchus destructor]